jgi:hypothetical protein
MPEEARRPVSIARMPCGGGVHARDIGEARTTPDPWRE